MTAYEILAQVTFRNAFHQWLLFLGRKNIKMAEIRRLENFSSQFGQHFLFHSEIQLLSLFQDDLHAKLVSYDIDVLSASQQEMFCKSYITSETLQYLFSTSFRTFVPLPG